jgi:hypothetical protein
MLEAQVVLSMFFLVCRLCRYVSPLGVPPRLTWGFCSQTCESTKIYKVLIVSLYGRCLLLSFLVETHRTTQPWIGPGPCHVVRYICIIYIYILYTCRHVRVECITMSLCSSFWSLCILHGICYIWPCSPSILHGICHILALQPLICMVFASVW